MRKIVAVCLVLTFMLSLAGCCVLAPGGQQKQTVEDYVTRAQTYIDAGQYDRAIAVLEEGIEATDAAVLKTMLATVNSMLQGGPSAETQTDTEPPETQQATQPVPETEAPTEVQPAFQSVPADMQYEINIFLSNFAEQSFNTYDPSGYGRRTTAFRTDSGDVALMVRFLFLYHKINNYSAIGSDDGWETLTVSRINQQAVRFFGRTFTTQQMLDAGLDIRGDRMYEIPAAGESYCTVAVAEALCYNGDGTYTVEVALYEASGRYVQLHGGITDRSVYYLTGAQARSDRDLTWKTGVTAVIRPYNDNGRATYQLVEYCLEGQK